MERQAAAVLRGGFLREEKDMRIFLAAALLIPVAVSAQEAAPGARPQVEMSPSAAHRLSVDWPIEAIIADPAGKAVLDMEMPSLVAHPAFEQFKAMSLRQLQPYSAGAITDEKIAAVEARLVAIGRARN